MGRPLDKALILAARKGHNERIRRLLAEGASVNARGRYGQMPLISAAERGHVETVLLLLEAGADPKLTPKDGSALYWAANRGHDQIVMILLAKGAPVNAIRDADLTPLSTALYHRHQDIALMLLEAGADPELRSHGRTMYDDAVKYGCERVVNYLRQREFRHRDTTGA